MAATTATIVQPDTSPYPVSTEQVGGIGFFVFSAIGAVLYLRRRLTKDKLESLKDRTEGLMLNDARTDRDKAMGDARQAWDRLNSMQQEHGRLIAENEYLRRELADAREQVTQIRQSVQQVGRKVDTAESSLKTAERRVSTTGPAPLSEK